MIATIVLASVLIDLTPEPENWVAEAAKYEAECAGKTTPDCKARRWQLEYQLWQDARTEYRGYTEVPEETMQVAMAAEVPQLKAWALDRLRHRGIRGPAEKDIVIAALDDPHPAVRDEAFDAMSSLNETGYREWERRRVHDSNPPMHGYFPNEKHAVEEYPGAKYRYFASNKERAFFTTSDAPSKVLAHFAKGGRKQLDEKQLQAELMAAQQPGDPMAMARAMQDAMAKGKNPQDIMAEMQNNSPSSVDPWAQLKGDEGVTAPKFVVLQTADFMGKKIPSRFVLVFKDEKLGATAIVYSIPKKQPKVPDYTNQKAVERETRILQELGKYGENP